MIKNFDAWKVCGGLFGSHKGFGSGECLYFWLKMKVLVRGFV